MHHLCAHFKQKMNKRSSSGSRISKRGFTLIEVVLVLAIGGLIFLLAFLAFNQVSVNRRDAQRRNDLNRIIAELQNYHVDKRTYPSASPNIASNVICSGGTAGSFAEFIAVYLCANGGFPAPSGTNYRANIPSDTQLTPDQIRYNVNEKCDGSPGLLYVKINLESGVACRDL